MEWTKSNIQSDRIKASSRLPTITRFFFFFFFLFHKRSIFPSILLTDPFVCSEMQEVPGWRAMLRVRVPGRHRLGHSRVEGRRLHHTLERRLRAPEAPESWVREGSFGNRARTAVLDRVLTLDQGVVSLLLLNNEKFIASEKTYRFYGKLILALFT